MRIFCSWQFTTDWNLSYQLGRSFRQRDTVAHHLHVQKKGQDSSIGTSLNSSMANPDVKYPFNCLTPGPCFLQNRLLHLHQLLAIQTLPDSHSWYIWKRVYCLVLCLADFFPWEYILPCFILFYRWLPKFLFICFSFYFNLGLLKGFFYSIVVFRMLVWMR